MFPSDADVERLIVLGRQRGGLTTEDLRRALPLDRMSADEVASLVTRLDDANVPVGIDPRLFTPAHRDAEILELKPGVAASPSIQPEVRPRFSGPDAVLSRAPGQQPSPALDTARNPRSRASTSMLVALAVLIILFLAWLAWRFV